MTKEVLRTPLYDKHVEAGGRMVEFAGYDMPVQYKSIIAESKAVRQHAGMFDVSHMARLRLTGARVTEYLEHITTNDISKLVPGRGQYSLLPNPAGGAVDDIIVYKVSDEEYAMVVNAANHAKDTAWMAEQNTFGVLIEDNTSATTMVAVQGPSAVQLLAEHSDAYEQLMEAPAFGLVQCVVNDSAHCFMARSGYTGEDGYELVCANYEAEALWDSLLQMGVEPCGLGSRDTLRVEAGLPLYGHELNDERSPIASGLGWVVSKTKSFIGSEHYQDARTNGTPTKLVGVKLECKRVAAIGSPVFVGDQQVGEVSSGVYSPILDCGIAFAFVNPQVTFDTPATIEFRGKMEPGTIVNKRFYKRG